MFVQKFQNVNDATRESLYWLIKKGSTVSVRGQETKELMHISFNVVHPEQRVMMLHHRNGNIFAQIAETLWMLAGRDDLDWLERYIPQCKRWSDNGKTWRAAYGPRLRGWYYCEDEHLEAVSYEIDQISEVVNKLRNDTETRQAVISLWDPAHDWVEGSKDYPCNNWLHFLIRDGKLHLNVAVRSNDVIYGFSHMDFFGWSVLQQLVASWVGVEIGTMSWNASSFHIYAKHYDKAQQIVQDNGSFPLYANVLPVKTGLDEFDATMERVFSSEYRWRVGDMDPNKDFDMDPDADMLVTFSYMLMLYNYWLNAVLPTNNANEYMHLMQMVLMLPDCDLRWAAQEYFGRNSGNIL